MPICNNCGAEFPAKRKDASLCSAKCRVSWSRKKAAEDGDPSVVWDGSQDTTNAEPVVGIPATPKKPSKSHVVLLKERTRERIRKAKGPSSTPPASSDVRVPDVPPEVDVENSEKITSQLGPEGVKALRGLYNSKGWTAIPGVHWTGPFKPVETHTDNQLARQVITSLKPQMTDPNSDAATLARLEKSQMKGKSKPQTKEEA